MNVKLGTDSIRTIAMFEKITRVHARDCLISDNDAYFVVDADKVGRAIGKNGSNMKDLRRVLNNRHVKIFACSESLEDTIRGMVPNTKKIEINGDSVVISVARNDKVSVIGKNGRNINAIREILKRHFSIRDLKLR